MFDFLKKKLKQAIGKFEKPELIPEYKIKLAKIVSRKHLSREELGK